ncbi:phosphoribosylaminoimidazolesuccinocarboxamide synthase [Bradyrhizobium sp. U87765 SZCCT0131]|uniref:phosphoribosylaminoimidazolesuccinocarboxamide synthase n=1 Tax=unclassified Bradyrhizobium TaxID=2631580 RepID=UPI001BA77894|nr:MULTISPECIES: phosphoribosylaminoimidazolesuccinocarboxamide synthase [unclassified Bradyrhizobium]MBR1219225.1 phosphoribosylaminoimidazolesuccinocarboxamide synthase [Bradyrhizobium sp. U87765 SZCCT0131]MBR1261876.1 phosphoribosylaminoimidazolesuccinocarboxamide synthase [Bradyrhizobium sp. U87765 SZCCT0134]MBR1306271.1 phosphoribosylaminoimidazolesuccinocarboxamide synthase [Bradyrhizobium sp. U87765 SZCCT0110]MBR1317658.1 phosphoribosylaminoimidazolesuccinocarboxamide synthase [Bradyrhiz
MTTAADLKPFARYTLADAHLPDLPGHYAGKVRENYDLPDGRRILIASDRISAFDVNLAVIPLKGQVLTGVARYWFDQTRDIVPNHVVAYPDPNVLVGRRLTMMPVEIVVRDYLAGTTSTSILQMYRNGERTMYGHAFPDGLRDNERLPQTIITPTTKAAHGDHDAPLSGAEVVSRGLLTQAQWDEVSAVALKLFARGREIAATRGLILVDTKYEFGFDEGGGLVLADEIHTPDSSRYWLAESYPIKFDAGAPPDTFDKDFVRRWVAARCDPYKDPIPPIPEEVILEAAAIYVSAYERITGTPFPLPDPSEAPLARIKRNVAAYLGHKA